MATTKKPATKNTVTKKTVTRPKATPARRARRTSETTAVIAAPDVEAVAQLAYHYFEESGYAHGHDVEHWLRAESDLRARV